MFRLPGLAQNTGGAIARSSADDVNFLCKLVHPLFSSVFPYSSRSPLFPRTETAGLVRCSVRLGGPHIQNCHHFLFNLRCRSASSSATISA